MAIKWKKMQAFAVALSTFLLPLSTYFLLLNLADPIVGDQNVTLSAISCIILFSIVSLVVFLTYFIFCCVTDENLQKLNINIPFALLFAMSFHLIVLYLRNKPYSISEDLFYFRLPTETYLFALYICLSRGRFFLNSLVLVSSDRLLKQWSEEHNKVLSTIWSVHSFSHLLLYLLPAVEFFLEVLLFPGLKHSTVVWLGGSVDHHSSVLKKFFTWICTDHVEVGGGFTMLGVPFYLILALLHLLVLSAVRNKTASNWFIVLTFLEGGLVLSTQILLLNPISLFVTFFVWLYIKPYQKITSKEGVITREELMYKGSGKESGYDSNSSQKSILPSSSNSSFFTSAASGKRSSVIKSGVPVGSFRYMPFDVEKNT